MIPVLEKLVQKGFNCNLLLGKESFQNYFSTKKGIKNLNYLNTIEPKYNVSLRAVFDSLFVEDSIAHEEFNPEVFSHVIGKVDSANIELLMRLIDQHGFPSESLIGIKGWFELDPITTLMKHHVEHPQLEERVGFEEVIISSAEKGWIKNYAVKTYLSSTFNFDNYSYSFGGDIIKWKIKGLPDSTSEKTIYSDSLFTYFHNIDSEDYNRLKLSKGLPTLEETFKLSKFNWEVKSDFIIGRQEKQEYEIDDIRKLKILKKNAKEIDIVPYVNN